MATVLSPTNYLVNVMFRVRQRGTGLVTMERRLIRLNRLINNIFRSVIFIGAAAGVQRVAKGFVELHTEIQNAEYGLAGVLTAITGTPIAETFQMARAEVNLLRRDAARLPGELPHFVEGLQQMLGPVLGAGGTLRDAHELTKLAITAGFAMRGQRGLETLPIDVAQALTQGIGDRITKDLSILIRAMGIKTSREFNQMTREMRLKVIMKALARMTEAATLMGRSFDAQAATLKDNVKQWMRLATGGLFDAITLDLRKINTWLDRNVERTEKWAKAIDKRVLRAYKNLGQTFRNAQRLAGTGAGAAGGLLGGRMALKAFGLQPTLLMSTAFAAIGTMIAHAARKYPEDAARAKAALINLGNAIGNFVLKLWRFVTENPFAIELGRQLIIRTTELAKSLADLVWAMTALVAISDRLISEHFSGKFFSGPEFEGMRKFFEAFGPWAAMDVLDRSRRFFWGEPPEKGPSLMDRIEGIAREIRATQPEDFDVEDFFRELALEGVGDTNLNGPVTIVIRAERVDNPDRVARSFREVAERLRQFRDRGRSVLTKRPV